MHGIETETNILKEKARADLRQKSFSLLPCSQKRYFPLHILHLLHRDSSKGKEIPTRIFGTGAAARIQTVCKSNFFYVFLLGIAFSLRIHHQFLKMKPKAS